MENDKDEKVKVSPQKVLVRRRGRPRLSDEEKARRDQERLERLQKNKEERAKREQERLERLQKNKEEREQKKLEKEAQKGPPKKRGRKFKPDKLTPAERAREYRKNPEYVEKHKAYCKSYNDKIRAMREYCVANDIKL